MTSYEFERYVENGFRDVYKQGEVTHAMIEALYVKLKGIEIAIAIVFFIQLILLGLIVYPYLELNI